MRTILIVIALISFTLLSSSVHATSTEVRQVTHCLPTIDPVTGDNYHPQAWSGSEFEFADGEIITFDPLSEHDRDEVRNFVKTLGFFTESYLPFPALKYIGELRGYNLAGELYVVLEVYFGDIDAGGNWWIVRTDGNGQRGNWCTIQTDQIGRFWPLTNQSTLVEGAFK